MIIDFETATNIRRLIEKECQRTSLSDLCEYWNVTIDEFYEYLNCADTYITQHEWDD